MNFSTGAGALPPMSVGVINYNGAGCVLDTLESIFNSGYPSLDVVVVDDCSTDNSPDMIKNRFPQARVFIQERNQGPNAARNRALREAKNEIVFITDNDITLEKNCLQLLAQSLLADDNAGVATPMVLDAVERDRIYSNGAALHFACFGVIPLRRQKIPAGLDMANRLSVCGSGGIMLTKKTVAEAVGMFDEDFYFGYDDGEYTYRVSASGRDVIQVPSARIYHIEKPGRNPKRLRYQVRGRLDFMLKNYASRSFVLLAPALFIFEAANFTFLAAKGAGMEWARGVGMILKSFGGIMEKRRATLSIKKRPDKELLTSGEIFMFPSRLGGGILPKAKKLFEGFLDAYWRVVSPFLTK
ncbi:MAG: glycosyltransferase [Nitrospinae bacterium]|nr:glycosyltransferase [Nitrospinota bacterium]